MTTDEMQTLQQGERIELEGKTLIVTLMGWKDHQFLIYAGVVEPALNRVGKKVLKISDSRAAELSFLDRKKKEGK